MLRFVVSTIETLGEGVVGLRLDNKSGRYFKFTPGQYVAIQTRRSGRPSASRCFSIVSIPSDPQLQLAFRVTGDYSYRLSRLQPGDVVYVQGPYGSFCVDERYDKDVVMLAAGIGITPLLSIARWLTVTKSPMKATLVYSCRRVETAPFIDELAELAQRNPNFRVVLACDTAPSQQRAGIITITGRLTDELLARLQPPTNTTYFICGSPAYMDHASALLKQGGVPNSRIIIEAFGQRKLGVPSLYQVGLARWYVMTALSITFLAGLFVAHGVMEQSEEKAKVTAQTASSTQTNTSDDDTPTTSSASGNSSNTEAQSTPTTTTPVPSTTPTSIYTYQQPTSSVS